MSRDRSSHAGCESDDPAHHVNSIRVLHMLRPFAVAMAGDNEFDPFKD